MNPRIESGGLQPGRTLFQLQALSCPASVFDPVGRETRRLRSTGHGTTECHLSLVLCRPGLKVPQGVGAVPWAEQAG